MDEIKSLDMIEHLLVCPECRSLFVEYSFLEDVLTAVEHYPDLKVDIENYIEEKETPAAEDISEFDEEILTDENEEPIIDTAFDETEILTEEEIDPVYPYDLDGSENKVDEEIQDLSTLETEIQPDEIEIQDNVSEEQFVLSEFLEDGQEEQPVLSENQILQDQDTSEENNNYSEGLQYEDETSDEEDTDETEEDITPSFTIPQIKTPEVEDEYTIMETTNLDDDFSFDSDDMEIKNVVLDNLKDETVNIEMNFDDINFNDETTDNTFIDETAEITEDSTIIDIAPNETVSDFEDTQQTEKIAFEDNLQEEPVINDTLELNEEIAPAEQPSLQEDTNIQASNIVELNFDNNFDDKNEDVNFEEMFNNDNIEIESNAVEAIKNDEELNNILNGANDISDSSDQEPAQEWNELFKESPAPENNIADTTASTEISSPEFNNDNNDNISIEEIDALYDAQDNNKIEINEDIEQKNENKAVHENKSVNTAVIIGLVVVILAIIGAGGFWFVSSNIINKGKDNNGEINGSYSTNNEYNEGGIDKVMTDAFSDNGITGNTLEIKKMSWDKNKSADMTPELKEYLNASASSIWDKLDETLGSVQGYVATTPSKILISVNKEGTVNNVKIAQSCGSKEVDSIVLNSVKSVLASMPPSSYSVKGENLNLTLVVNF